MKEWQTFIDPFIVSLLDTNGQQVASRRFRDGRPFYVWRDVDRVARFVRIDSLDYKGVICGQAPSGEVG